MLILGIGDNHDCGACLVRDGELICALNEERLNRRKLAGGFPYLSIQKAIDMSGISPEEIDMVALASYMTPVSMMRLIDGFHDRLRKDCSSFSYLLNLYVIYQLMANRLSVPRNIEKFLSVRVIKNKLKKINLNIPVRVIEHHHAHAASAYYTSGMLSRALIISIDAMGDALSLTVNIGEDGFIRRIFSQSGFSAINSYYANLTEFLGFQPINHEGKITGLAAYGKFNAEILRLANQKLRFTEGRKAFNLRNYFLKQRSRDTFYAGLKKYSHEDIAYNFQHNFEEEIAKFVEFWVKETGIQNLCLAGGAFANVSLNQRLSLIESVKNLYIFPHMGDGGLALGAALALLRQNPFYLKNIYLGPDYNDECIETAIDEYGLCRSFLDEEALCKKIAELLYAGKTVAHFNSRMEYGPRALGNRSILYRADDPSCACWLNKKLKRTDFMPFAPLTLDTEADQLYTGIEKIKYTLRFMNIAVDCNDKMKKLCPGVVHIDGTARPQILRREDNPRIYKILEAYRDLKGTSTVLNTSFNRHEDPIVCSARDALKSFLECGLDYLILNNFLIWKKAV